MSQHLKDLIDGLHMALLGGDIRIEVVAIKGDSVVVRVTTGEWCQNKGLEWVAQPRTENW